LVESCSTILQQVITDFGTDHAFGLTPNNDPVKITGSLGYCQRLGEAYTEYYTGRKGYELF